MAAASPAAQAPEAAAAPSAGSITPGPGEGFDTLVGQAEDLLAQGGADRAVVLASRAVKERPDNLTARAVYERARRELLRGRRRERLESRIQDAEARLQAGDLVGAERIVTSALKLVPDHKVALALFGRMKDQRARAGHLAAEAEAELERLGRSQVRQALDAARAALAAGWERRALLALRRGLRLVPDHPELLGLLKEIQESASLEIDDARRRSLLAQIRAGQDLLAEGRLAESLKMLRAVLREDPDNVRAQTAVQEVRRTWLQRSVRAATPMEHNERPAPPSLPVERPLVARTASDVASAPLPPSAAAPAAGSVGDKGEPKRAPPPSGDLSRPTAPEASRPPGPPRPPSPPRPPAPSPAPLRSSPEEGRPRVTPAEDPAAASLPLSGRLRPGPALRPVPESASSLLPEVESPRAALARVSRGPTPLLLIFGAAAVVFAVVLLLRRQSPPQAVKPPGTAPAPTTLAAPLPGPLSTVDPALRAAVERTLGLYERALESQDAAALAVARPDLTPAQRQRLLQPFVGALNVATDLRVLDVGQDRRGVTVSILRTDVIVSAGRGGSSAPVAETLHFERTESGWELR